ncbi:MAG: NADH-quinone oxidoreductase subunit H [Candidatus Micrarchaeota archaeon]|nr:NADH-quinone oxidoreductase subunit H [Candidatus Micrarchaeota archaeon]
MFIDALSSFEASHGISLPPIANAAIVALAFGILVLIGSTVFDYMFGWVERKVIAKVQLRHGPTRVGKFGLLQNLADFIKLFAKEHVIPARANRLLFLWSLPLVAAILTFLIEIIPYGPNIFGVDLSLGILVAFVLLSFLPIVIFVAGWASANKFASIAAQRSVIMLISYEVPLFIVVAGVALLSGSLSFLSIVKAQSHLWFIALLPIGFVVFFIALMAELERPPFDLREADSELIAGWMTDLSAPLYAMSLYVDYTRVFLGSLLVAILFLGGWSGPVLPPLVWLMIKVVVIAVFVVIVRATTPRMRLDRIMRLGWFWLVPLSIINLAIAFAFVSNII